MEQVSILRFFKPRSIDIVTQSLDTRTSTEDGPKTETSPVDKSARVETKEILESGLTKTQDEHTFDTKQNATEIFIPLQCPNAAIVRVHEAHLLCLKNMTATLFPVRYSSKFFSECVRDNVVSQLSRVLLWNSRPVGWIRCKLETDQAGSTQIYIQIIGILAPYRGVGLASALLQQVLCQAIIKEQAVSSVYVHVWQANTDAMQWYENQGFTCERLENNYYRSLKPAAAWIMRKILI